MAKKGRPPIQTEKIVKTLCERLSIGRSLNSICKDGDMPCITTVMKWLSSDESFAAKYARAREVQAEYLLDELIEIADTPKLGIKTVTKDSGVETTEGDMIEHRRLQVDVRKWAIARMYPRKYNERLMQEKESGELKVIIENSPDGPR